MNSALSARFARIQAEYVKDIGLSGGVVKLGGIRGRKGERSRKRSALVGEALKAGGPARLLHALPAGAG